MLKLANYRVKYDRPMWAKLLNSHSHMTVKALNKKQAVAIVKGKVPDAIIMEVKCLN